MKPLKNNPLNPRMFFLILPLIFLIGCHAHIPTKAFQLDSESMKLRELQTRIFPIDDEIKVLKACSTLLQDLGFTIEENEAKLGIVTASKDREALNIKNVILSALGVQKLERKQVMNVSITTRTIGEEKKRIAVRVTIQRMVFDSGGNVTKKESLTQPKIYRDFFDKLSKSLFLEGEVI